MKTKISIEWDLMSLVVSPDDAYVLVEKLEAHLAALPAR